MVTISTDGPIWTLDLGADENRFTPEWLDEVNAALDKVETAEGPAVLVTSGHGKFYSNGLDLDWLGQNFDQYAAYVERVQTLLARLLTFPVPTVAALNGHAFGAGAMLAIAHDYRVMREDRGYFCFPEIDIQIPFTPGMNALITSKLTPRSAFNAMATGRRYSGPDALAEGLVDATAGLDQLTRTASDQVIELATKDRATLGTIKARLFASVVDALRDVDASA
ncbi:enoyl-CoA hydratase-related protein [Nocardioides sp. CPCC 206347]|uniref:enoyl-CoA hydratase-related protein n=1 Tax=unclassified Nocardioides TaxID=2615069 RepID=UPI00361FDBFF